MLLLGLLGWVAPLAAQTIRLQNLTPVPRREVVAVVVPFPRGAMSATPALYVEDKPTVWQPFGARWPDGSVRQALCLFEAEVQGLAEVEVPLKTGPVPDIPAEWRDTPITMPTAELTFVAVVSGGEHRCKPEHVAWLEDNPLRRVALRRGRIGDTGLVAECIVHQARGDAHAYVDVAVFFSDPTSTAMQIPVDRLAIEADGMALLLRHPGRLGVQQQTNARGSTVVLLSKQLLGDGMGIRRTGCLVPTLRGDGGIEDRTLLAATVCPLLGGVRWGRTGAFGAFGEPATLPSWLEGDGARAMLAQRHAAFVRDSRPGGDPLGAPYFGPAKNPGQTGDQRDFGVVKLSVTARTGLPSQLLEIEASVLQEACRPVHNFEADGRPVRASDHPEWIVWSGRTHWHEKVSPDRLGKPHPEPKFERHGWGGKDRQHWSSNYLGAYALLTGAHWARLELANEVELYLSGQTTRPDKSTSGPGAPRGAGRTLLAATWMWLATGDARLLARINERIDRVYLPSWQGRRYDEHAVRTMAAQGPDARMLDGKQRYWTPWQDALAAVGFAAAHRVTGNRNARVLAEELALTVVRHGYRLDERECIIATAIRWQNGEPLTPEQLAASRREDVLWSHGTAFSEWAIGAVEIARTAARQRGDAETESRAEQIQARVRAARSRPGNGDIDRLSEWDCVVWEPALR